MREINKKIHPSLTIQLLIFFNLLLALLSFIKDVVFASYFGTTEIADSISIAFFVPDTLGNNLIGAAIGVSSIPVLTRLAIKENHNLYYKTIQKLIGLLLGATLLLCVLLIFLSEPLFELFQFNLGNFSFIKQYFIFMLPIICLAPFWLMGSSILQASNQYIIPAITPIVFNFILLVSLLCCQWLGVSQIQGGNIYSISITISTLFVCLLTWYVVRRRQKVSWKLDKNILKYDFQEVKKVLYTFIAYFWILFFYQVSLLMERVIASSLDTGTIAALTYAYRISQFPLWVFIAAINTFILPTISFYIETKDFYLLKRDLHKSFLLVIGCSGFLSVILVLFSYPILTLFLSRGAFTADSVSLTSGILKGYALSITGQSLFVFCTRYFVAESKMKVPFTIGFFGSCLNIFLLYFFVPRLGANGIGYAVAISATISGLWILHEFRKNVLHLKEKEGEAIE